MFCKCGYSIYLYEIECPICNKNEIIEGCQKCGITFIHKCLFQEVEFIYYYDKKDRNRKFKVCKLISGDYISCPHVISELKKLFNAGNINSDIVDKIYDMINSCKCENSFMKFIDKIEFIINTFQPFIPPINRCDHYGTLCKYCISINPLP